MTDLADLFEGFAAHWINTSIGKIFARVGGSGPPLLLLHGYPQTHVMWHRVAPKLSERFTVIAADLPGYGWSAAPKAGDGHAPYTKRAMARVMIEAMEKIGYVRFHLASHDRGARVAYRLVLDNPGRVEKLAVLDIIPTSEMWARMDKTLATATWHWLFLAQPRPLPEMMIGQAPVAFLDAVMTKWSKDISAFDPRALQHYRTAFQDPSRIAATCDDYRAGRYEDLAADEADRAAGKKIPVPVLTLWGNTGFVNAMDPLAIWRRWADDVTGRPIDSGHFLCEENPGETADELIRFFAP
jgi:haloacetate dehalogenase